MECDWKPSFQVFILMWMWAEDTRFTLHMCLAGHNPLFSSYCYYGDTQRQNQKRKSGLLHLCNRPANIRIFSYFLWQMASASSTIKYVARLRRAENCSHLSIWHEPPSKYLHEWKISIWSQPKNANWVSGRRRERNNTHKHTHEAVVESRTKLSSTVRSSHTNTETNGLNILFLLIAVHRATINFAAFSCECVRLLYVVCPAAATCNLLDGACCLSRRFQFAAKGNRNRAI